MSQSAKESVIAYIFNQELHHHEMTFEEEFSSNPGNARFAFDRRYLGLMLF